MCHMSPCMIFVIGRNCLLTTPLYSRSANQKEAQSDFAFDKVSTAMHFLGSSYKYHSHLRAHNMLDIHVAHAEASCILLFLRFPALEALRKDGRARSWVKQQASRMSLRLLCGQLWRMFSRATTELSWPMDRSSFNLPFNVSCPLANWEQECATNPCLKGVQCILSSPDAEHQNICRTLFAVSNISLAEGPL